MRITWIDIQKHIHKEAAMPYTTFGPDMKATGKEMGKAIKDCGKVIVKYYKDPFAMTYPLARNVGLLLWCGTRMTGYVVRKIFD